MTAVTQVAVADLLLASRPLAGAAAGPAAPGPRT
jgi:hypothetical protein